MTVDVTNTFDKPVQIVLTAEPGGSIINQRLNPGQQARGSFDLILAKDYLPCPSNSLSHLSMHTTDGWGFSVFSDLHGYDNEVDLAPNDENSFFVDGLRYFADFFIPDK